MEVDLAIKSRVRVYYHGCIPERLYRRILILFQLLRLHRKAFVHFDLGVREP